jgi:DNA repair exonuclease SbcCD ATPase subunit
MILRLLKYGLLTVAGGAVVVSLLFGGEALSYVRTSGRSVRQSVNEHIPLEFQLRRARDLLGDILPEMQANVRVMAQQEVEIEAARDDIEQSQKSLVDEAGRIRILREAVQSGRSNFTLAGLTYTRDQLTQELARRFDRYREAEQVLAAKRKLFDNRRQSLAAAEQQLEQMRVRKVALESQVEALTGQYRLVQTASSNSKVQIDVGKLAQAERLVAEIRQHLNVAEHVLAREAKFTQPIPVDSIDPQDLVARVVRHFGAGEASPASTVTAPAAATRESDDAPVAADVPAAAAAAVVPPASGAAGR